MTRNFSCSWISAPRISECLSRIKMTPRKWVLTTQNYHSRLEALNLTRHYINVPKNPRALMEMLGEVELKVASRILKNDFICESFRIANCNRPTYPSVVT